MAGDALHQLLLARSTDWSVAGAKTQEPGSVNHICALLSRHYYQKGYRCAPHWFLRLTECVVPAPDLILYLHRSAEDIYAAKPELDLDEIKRQQILIRSLVTSRSNAVVVDASGGIEAAVDRLGDLITRKILRDFDV